MWKKKSNLNEHIEFLIPAFKEKGAFCVVGVWFQFKWGLYTFASQIGWIWTFEEMEEEII